MAFIKTNTLCTKPEMTLFCVEP